jgi:hypothetical protein
LEIGKTHPTNEDVVYFGIAIKLVDTAYPKLISFRDLTTYQVGIRINTDGTVSIIKNGISGTVLYTSSKVLSLNTWYHISAEFTIHSSSGTAKLWINGELITSLTGQNTQQSANAYANQIYLLSTIIKNQTDWYIDDFYSGDDTGSINISCPTESRVTTLYPTSSGTYDEWSFTGTSYAWQAVDDANPDDNSTFIYSSVSGTKSTFTFGDLEADADSVYAVQFVNYGRKDDADIRATRFLMGVPAGTFYEFSTGSYVGSDYQYFTYIQETDPITAGALTPTIINDNEYGIVVSL